MVGRHGTCAVTATFEQGTELQRPGGFAPLLGPAECLLGAGEITAMSEQRAEACSCRTMAAFVRMPVRGFSACELAPVFEQLAEPECRCGFSALGGATVSGYCLVELALFFE